MEHTLMQLFLYKLNILIIIKICVHIKTFLPRVHFLGNSKLKHTYMKIQYIEILLDLFDVILLGVAGLSVAVCAYKFYSTEKND